MNVPWSKAHAGKRSGRGPTINADYFLMVVAVLGTTISPYLFFWQASQEVEEMNQGKVDRPLRDLARGGHIELDRIKIDTTIGMIFSNAIAFFIILTTAAVLQCPRRHQHQFGKPGGGSAASAGRRFDVPAVSRSESSAPACWQSRCWPARPPMAWRKRSAGPPRWRPRRPTRSGSTPSSPRPTMIGFGLGFTGIDAIHMLVWSAVLNGIVAVPIMAMMMVIVSNSKLMGRFRARSWLLAMGWIGTAIMAMAVIALFWSFLAKA